MGGAIDVVNVTCFKHLRAFIHPVLDDLKSGIGQFMIAMRFDLAIADIDDSDLVHFDAALAVFSVDPEDGGPVFTDTKIKLGKLASHVPVNPLIRFCERLAQIRRSGELVFPSLRQGLDATCVLSRTGAQGPNF